MKPILPLLPFLRARPLTNHVQQTLTKAPLPGDVTVVSDMDALNFS